MTEEGDRLLTLAAILEKLRAERFRMGWVIPTMPSAKSPACALGWALVQPEFTRLGLVKGRTPDSLLTIRYQWKEEKQTHHLHGFQAVMRFFGLTMAEVWDAFTPDGYRAIPVERITPQMVAAKLRELARKRIGQ